MELSNTLTLNISQEDALYQQDRGGRINPLVLQVLNIDAKKHDSVFTEETENLDVVAAKVLHNMRCRGRHLTEEAFMRIEMIASMVVAKHRGWREVVSPESTLWASEQERLLFAYLLACDDLQEEEREDMLRKWILTGKLGHTIFKNFLSSADKGRKKVMEDEFLFPDELPKGNPVVNITVYDSDGSMQKDYFDQVIFCGLRVAPIVVLNTMIWSKEEKSICHSVTVTAYDRRYLNIEPMVRKIDSMLRESAYITELRALEPPIQSILIPSVKSEKVGLISDIVEKYRRNYKPE